MTLTTKRTASHAWLLLGYTICILSPFCMQHHTSRQIMTGIAIAVVLYVATRLARARRNGGCTA